MRQHKCRRWETLASVAVAYGCDVASLRRLNNLMSDDALRSRVRVYVPGDRNACWLITSTRMLCPLLRLAQCSQLAVFDSCFLQLSSTAHNHAMFQLLCCLAC